MAVSLNQFLTHVNAKSTGNAQWLGHCPSHEDHTASLSIGIGTSNNGSGRQIALINCFSCNDNSKVVAALKAQGMWPIDIDGKDTMLQVQLSKRNVDEIRSDREKQFYIAQPADKAPDKFAQLAGFDLVKKHLYTDERGRLIGYVLRYETTEGERHKQFRPLFHSKHPETGEVAWHAKQATNPQGLRYLYGLETLIGKPDSDILLVEGEKTADAARKIFPALVVLSPVGGLNGFKKADLSPLIARNVIIWGDHDKEWFANAKAWADHLWTSKPNSIRIVTLPDTLPNKWDLADDPIVGVSRDRLLQQAEPYNNLKTYNSYKTIDELAKDVYVIVDKSGHYKYKHVRTKTEWAPAALKIPFGHLRDQVVPGTIAGALDSKLRDLDQVCDGTSYVPGGPRLVIEDTRRMFNLYEASTIPAKSGDVSWYTDFLKYLWSEDDVKHFLFWVAHLVQKPSIKINHSIMLIGAQGMGKSMNIEAIRQLVGTSNARNARVDDVGGRFNDFARNVVLVVLEEVEHTPKFYVNLKTIITDDSINVEAKNVSSATYRNYANVIGSSNREDPVRLPPETDRRFFFMRTTHDKPLPGSDYKELGYRFANNMPELMGFFQQYDLTDFNPKAPPPRNAHKLYVEEMSLPEYERQFIEYVVDGEYPLNLDIYKRKDMIDILTSKWGQRVGNRAKELIEKHGAILPVTEITKTTRQMIPYYFIRHVDRYMKLSPEQRFAAYQEERKRRIQQSDII